MIGYISIGSYRIKGDDWQSHPLREVVSTVPLYEFQRLTTCRVAQKLTFHLAAPMVVLTNSRIGTERQKQKIPIRCS